MPTQDALRTLLRTGDFVLNGACAPACLFDEPGELRPLSLRVRGGRIAELSRRPLAPGGGERAIEADGRQVWPCPVDLHTHLDKGHIRPRSPNPDGTFGAALAATARDQSARWTALDLEARMDFALRAAFAHGTRAVRTHLDSVPPQDGITWPVFAKLRERWAGRIELQGVSLALLEHMEGEAATALARRVAEHGGLLGLVPFMTRDLPERLDAFFALARRFGLACDLHVDESLDPAARCLDAVAAAVLRNGYQGQVVVGHCCSLAAQDERTAALTIRKVAEAGLTVVTLPMCNLYLQDRKPGRTPRFRGVTLVHELAAGGVPLVAASDNTRDPFHGYGDLDPLEVFRETVRTAHLDHPLDRWPLLVTETPGRVFGGAFGTLRAGAPADFVLFDARGFDELLARPQADRIVLRDGRPLDRALPDYRELDPFMDQETDRHDRLG